jgi:hypothetical protein
VGEYLFFSFFKNRTWWFSEKGENHPTQVSVHYTKPPTNSHLHSFKFQGEARYDQSPVTFKTVNSAVEAAF